MGRPGAAELLGQVRFQVQLGNEGKQNHFCFLRFSSVLFSQSLLRSVRNYCGGEFYPRAMFSLARAALMERERSLVTFIHSSAESIQAERRKVRAAAAMVTR